MSGVRLVGARGRDETYVSAGNPTHRKGRGGGGREGPVLGAGVGAGETGRGFRTIQRILLAVS